MSLLALIKKGGLEHVATMTAATIATLETKQVVTVANVATVTVTEQPEPGFYSLTLDEEYKIHTWLAHINETNQENIDNIINKCRTDLKVRFYLLKRSEETPHSLTVITPVACGNCTNLERINHPHLGHCTKGELEAIAGLWDDDHRYCESYIPTINQSINQHGDHHDDI